MVRKTAKPPFVITKERYALRPVVGLRSLPLVARE